MISLLAALMAGFGLGKFLPSGRPAYLFCVPLSAVVYVLTNAFFSSLQTSGMEIPDVQTIIVVAVLQAPLLMLGVFLGRRHTKRNRFEA